MDTKMAAAEARGMQDAGLMAVGKHYPGAEDSLPIDSHMAEAISFETKEELSEKLRETAKPGDIIWLKASRGMRFEDIAEAFYEET